MPRSFTFHPDLSKLFPKELPLARLMARLFVLWQDLVYEEAGILGDDGFAVMDEKMGDASRRLYFLRGNSRTLNSTKALLDQLVADPTFAGWLRDDASLKERFFSAKGSFDKHREAFDHVRNTIGAHVEQDLGDAIDEFAPGDTAPFEIHEHDFMRPHLASTILVAVLMKGAPPNERTSAYRRAVKPLAEATGAMIRAMSEAVGAYMERLGLLPDEGGSDMPEPGGQMTAIIAVCGTDYAVLGADSRVTPGPMIAEKLWTFGGQYAVASIGSGPVGVPQAMRSYPLAQGTSTQTQACRLLQWLQFHGLFGDWQFCMVGPGLTEYECWVGNMQSSSVGRCPQPYIMPADSTEPSWPALRQTALGPRAGVSADVQLVRNMLDAQSKAFPAVIGPPHTIAVVTR